MKTILLSMMVAGLAASALQAANNPAPNKAPSGGGDKRAEFIKKYDKNGDGKLDKKEREAARKAHQAALIKQYDKNGNGKIDREERDAAREEFRKQRQKKEEAEKTKKENPEKKPSAGSLP